MKRRAIAVPKLVAVHFCANCGDVGGADPYPKTTSWDWECKCAHGIPAIHTQIYAPDFWPKPKRRRKRARR